MSRVIQVIRMIRMIRMIRVIRVIRFIGSFEQAEHVSDTMWSMARVGSVWGP